jgi:predicted RNase H-like HicB family nuclease
MERFGFTAIFELIEDGWWLARCEEVSEAITQGETLDEAREMLADVVRLVLEVRREEAERELLENPREGVVREPLSL